MRGGHAAPGKQSAGLVNSYCESWQLVTHDTRERLSSKRAAHAPGYKSVNLSGSQSAPRAGLWVARRHNSSWRGKQLNRSQQAYPACLITHGMQQVWGAYPNALSTLRSRSCSGVCSSGVCSGGASGPSTHFALRLKLLHSDATLSAGRGPSSYVCSTATIMPAPLRATWMRAHTW